MREGKARYRIVLINDTETRETSEKLGVAPKFMNWEG